MSDFFGEPAAMVEMDESKANNFIVEGMAKLNSGDRSNEETLAIHRAAGDDFIKAKELLGRGNWLARIATRAKRSERQIKRIIALAESPDTLPVEEQMAILWGHPASAKTGGSGRSSGPSSPTAFSRPKFFGGINRVKVHSAAFLRENGIDEEDARYKAIVKAAETIEAKFKELEKKVQP